MGRRRGWTLVAGICVALQTSSLDAQTRLPFPAAAPNSSVSANQVLAGTEIAPELTGAPLQQTTGSPSAPRHPGIGTMLKGIVVDFKYLPARSNAVVAAMGGGLALALHPLDDNVNRSLVGNGTAENVFKAGAVMGQLGTLLSSAALVYTVGRLRDEPKVSHVGADLIRSLAMSEVLTQTLKYTTRRERPDGSSRNSFPSGHAADTFAFATAIERHLGWRYSVPAFAVASYVAISRLPANRHWLSDAVFGSTVGFIAGRTVTGHEANPFPIAVIAVPGGVALAYVRTAR